VASASDLNRLSLECPSHRPILSPASPFVFHPKRPADLEHDPPLPPPPSLFPRARALSRLAPHCRFTIHHSGVALSLETSNANPADRILLPTPGPLRLAALSFLHLPRHGALPLPSSITVALRTPTATSAPVLACRCYARVHHGRPRRRSLEQFEQRLCE